MDHQETKYDDKLEVVIEGIEQAGEDDNLIRLSTGVILKSNPFPRTMLADIVRKFPEPKVPMFYNEDKERDEENPNDPDYIEAVKKYQFDLTFALVDLGICYGTSIKELPKDIDNPYSSDWVDTCNALGLEVPANKKLRYLKWVKYIAAPEEKDIEAIADKVLASFGTRESQVEKALETFPSES